MRRALPLLLAALPGLPACAEPVFAPDDGGLDAWTAADAGVPDAEPGPDSGGLLVVPSNVGAEVLPGSAGTVELDVGGDGYLLWVLNTDSGQIKKFENADGTGDSQEVRGPDEGVGAGIFFGIVPQSEPDAPELGVFAVNALRVRAGAILQGRGSRALVFVVRDDVTIEGSVSVAPLLWDGGWEPGPAGGFGGDPSMEYFDGNGPGFGHGGDDGDPEDGGGGGASFGRQGGSGGTDMGGEQEPVYGSEPLVPLLGGSGGGGGADRDGGFGGHGGGALQITAGGTIRVPTGGVVEAGGRGGGGGAGQDIVTVDTGGGGGGGSGGAILLEALVIEIEGAVAANGGAGGQGGRLSFPGADGSPGRALTAPATGSPSEDIGGGGGSGSDNSGDPAPGAPAENGGGGGGGCGRLRFNNLDATGYRGSGSITPDPGSSSTTVGMVLIDPSP